MNDELNHHPRWRLMRDVLVFQAKLLVDGLRDLILSPVSLVAGLVGLIADRDDPARHFRKVLEFGANSEVWINLFNRHGRKNQPGDLDDLFRQWLYVEGVPT